MSACTVNNQTKSNCILFSAWSHFLMSLGMPRKAPKNHKNLACTQVHSTATFTQEFNKIFRQIFSLFIFLITMATFDLYIESIQFGNSNYNHPLQFKLELMSTCPVKYQKITKKRKLLLEQEQYELIDQQYERKRN